MSKPKAAWWSYIKQILIRYPNVTIKEKEAIEKTITLIKKTGKLEKLQFIDLVYFRKTTNIEGVQKYLFISYPTAVRWNGEIFRHIATYLGLIERPTKDAIFPGKIVTKGNYCTSE